MIKYLKIVSLTMVITVSSCGTTHQVITDSGEIYEVKGDTYYKDGKDVTSKISDSEKDHIVTTLNRRLESEDELLAQQEAIEEAREEAEKALEEADEQATKEARENYIQANKDLNQAQKSYKRLRKKEGFSTKDDAKWTKKINDLSDKLKETEQKLNNLMDE